MEVSVKPKRSTFKHFICTILAICLCIGLVDAVPVFAGENGVLGVLLGTDADRCVTDGNAIAQGKAVTEANATFDHYYPNKPKFEWSEDGKTCDAVFTCKYKDGTKTVACKVKKKVEKKASATEDGKITYTATVKMNSTTYTSTKKVVVPKVDKVTLSEKTMVYTGKFLTPEVVVADSQGNTLPTDVYNIYFSNNKNIGQATVTIQFKGSDYKGSVEKTFSILPAAVSVKSVTAGKNSFTAKWKKGAGQLTGYQVRYSTDISFKASVKTVKIKDAAAVTKKIEKLDAKNTYYVQIRAYAAVEGKTYYSSWSDTYKVVTK